MSNESVLNAFNSPGASPGGSKIRIPNYSEAVVPVYHAPPGSYPAVVTGFKETVSQAGNNMFVLEIEADVGGGKSLSRKLHCTLPVPMTANALGKIKRTFMALSVPPDVEVDAKLIIGKPCTANVQDGKEYKGKPTSDIDSLDLPGQATGPIDKADATAGPTFPPNDDIAF